jgi:hypothetical protein
MNPQGEGDQDEAEEHSPFLEIQDVIPSEPPKG